MNITMSESIASLAGALAKAQAEMPPVPKTKTGSVQGESKGTGRAYDFSYKYADIADVLAIALPVLGRHGIAVMQPTFVDGNRMYLLTRLVHSSGDWMESLYPVCELQGNHQKMGASLTYARRYALSSLIGIAAEEDTDAGGGGTMRSSDGKDPGRFLKQKIHACRRIKQVLDLMMAPDTQEQLEQLDQETRASVRAYALDKLAGFGWEPPKKKEDGEKDDSGESDDPDPPEPERAPANAGPPEPERRRRAASPPPPPPPPAPEPEPVFDEAETLKAMEEHLAVADSPGSIEDVADLHAPDLELLSRTGRERWEHLLEQARKRFEAEPSPAEGEGEEEEEGELDPPPPPPRTKPQVDPFEIPGHITSPDEYRAWVQAMIQAATTFDHAALLRDNWKRTQPLRQDLKMPMADRTALQDALMNKVRKLEGTA